MALLKWVSKTLEIVKSSLGEEDMFRYELVFCKSRQCRILTIILTHCVLVNNISYVGYKFYFKANCCLEAYTVNKIFMEHAFKLADAQNINEDQAMVKQFFK